jgi:hypothetical protein
VYQLYQRTVKKHQPTNPTMVARANRYLTPKLTGKPAGGPSPKGGQTPVALLGSLTVCRATSAGAELNGDGAAT